MDLETLVKHWAGTVSDDNILVFGANDILYKEGEKTTGAFIILEGEVKLTRKNGSGKTVLITRIGANEAVGTMSLLEDNWVRPNTAVVVTDKLKAVKISKEKFDSQFCKLDPTHQLFIRLLSQRLKNSYKRIYNIV